MPVPGRQYYWRNDYDKFIRRYILRSYRPQKNYAGQYCCSCDLRDYCFFSGSPFCLGFFAALPGLFIFAVIIVVIIYFIIRFQKVEYEYIFTSGDLDFDQLSGDFRRKRKLSVTFESLEVLAPEGSHWLDGYGGDGGKTYDFSSRDKSKKRYVYVGSGNNGRIKVIFEPSEKMLQNMYNYSPSKVKIEG